MWRPTSRPRRCDPPPHTHTHTHTTWTILERDGPNHPGVWYNVLPEHQTALITSDCGQIRPGNAGRGRAHVLAEAVLPGHPREERHLSETGALRARPPTAHTHPTPPRPLSSSSSLSPLSPLSSWSSSCSSCSSRPPAAAHAALRPPPARNVGPSCLPDSLAMGPRPPKMTVLDH